MRRFLSSALLGTILLSACTGSKTSSEDIGDTFAPGAIEITTMLAQQMDVFLRPSANLGLFTSLYISQSGFFPVVAALRGIAAEVNLHSSKDLGSDSETYALLQEFGGVLRTDIPDMLNRSSDRARSLNEYMAGLENITERSARKADELDGAIVELTAEHKEKRARVTEIQRTINTALRDQDYAAAAAEQQNLGEAQSELSEVESKLNVTKNVTRTYRTLLGIAEKRKNAIDANREIIIAGLSVVQLPGIEDLDILERGNSQFGGGNGGSSGFFQF